MRVFDNGWYRICGSTVTSHYFFDDKPIHLLKHGQFIIDFSKRYRSDYKTCARCVAILKAYPNGLENRLI